MITNLSQASRQAAFPIPMRGNEIGREAPVDQDRYVRVSDPHEG